MRTMDCDSVIRSHQETIKILFMSYMFFIVPEMLFYDELPKFPLECITESPSNSRFKESMKHKNREDENQVELARFVFRVEFELKLNSLLIWHVS